MSSTVDSLARPRVWGSSLILPQMSSFESCMVRSLAPSSGWNHVQNVKLCRLPGKVTPSKVWLKLWPNVKLRILLGGVTCSRFWLLGRVTCSRFLFKLKPKVKNRRLLGRFALSIQHVETKSKRQAPKTAWQRHSFQTAVETIAKCQALKNTRQPYPFQALVKIVAKCQALQIARQGHPLQALVEARAKCQALKTVWQGHLFQALVETVAKCQAFKGFWQIVQILKHCYGCTLYLCHPLQCKLSRNIWQSLDTTPCSIWSDSGDLQWFGVRVTTVHPSNWCQLLKATIKWSLPKRHLAEVLISKLHSSPFLGMRSKKVHGSTSPALDMWSRVMAFQRNGRWQSVWHHFWLRRFSQIAVECARYILIIPWQPWWETQPVMRLPQ